MPDKIALRSGEPIEFLLDGPCQEVPSDVHGTEWRYTVNGGMGYIYLPRLGRDALLRANAQPGDLLRLEKLQRGRTQHFNIEVMSDAAEPAQAAPHSGAVPRDFGETLARESSERRLSRPAKHHQAPPVSNIRAAQALAVLPVRAGSAAELVRNSGLSAAAQHMALCMCDAVDVISVVQLYQRQVGVAAEFGDVRALGLSVYINDQKAGGAR